MLADVTQGRDTWSGKCRTHATSTEFCCLPAQIGRKGRCVSAVALLAHAAVCRSAAGFVSRPADTPRGLPIHRTHKRASLKNRRRQVAAASGAVPPPPVHV